MISLKVSGVPFFPPLGKKFGLPFDLIVTLSTGSGPRWRNKAGATTRQCSMMPSEHIWNVRSNHSKKFFAVSSERNCKQPNSGNGRT